MTRTTGSQLAPPETRGMSTMLEFDAPHRHDWRPEELRDMLRHQLAAPLQLSLGPMSAEASHAVRLAKPPVDPLLSMGQLFHSAHPPLELLKLVKRFAKMCRGERDNPLPSELVMLMYYMSIAVALVRRDQHLSNLSPASLGRGLGWLAAQPWVDAATRGVLQDALSRVTMTAPAGSEPATRGGNNSESPGP